MEEGFRHFFFNAEIKGIEDLKGKKIRVSSDPILTGVVDQDVYKRQTLGAYEYCWNRIGKGRLGYILGWIPLLGSLGIAIGYAIIVGWVVRALAGSVTGAILTEDAAAYFSQATGNFGSVPWHVLVIVIAAAILMFGATKGIEKIRCV